MQWLQTELKPWFKEIPHLVFTLKIIGGDRGDYQPHFFDFFTSPYKEATSFDIGLEVTAVLFGIISVVFAQKASVWVYPTGLVSTLIYVYVCLQYVLLGDMIINIYYSFVSIYGWYLWASATDQKPLPISFCSPKEWLQVGLIFVFTVLFIIGLYLYFDRFNQFTDYADTFTTGIFFAGMWLMANKKIENWILDCWQHHISSFILGKRIGVFRYSI